MPVKGTEENLVDRWFIKALAHPVRVEILELLNEREASPSEMKRMLGGTLNLINYHLRVLQDCGCVEISRTEPVRGAVKHFYRAVPRSFLGHQDLRDVPASIRGGATELSLRSFLKILSAAAEAGTLDSDDTILSWLSLAVDEVGREEVIELSESTLQTYELIARRSRERAAAAGGQLLPLVVALAAFETGAVAGN
jgi:DNA-binding transcriptional ArsR family regulator